MDKWAGFYEKLFNFREIRYFDIEGKKTGLFSRAMTSPCGKIRIPINESQDDKSQIEEYLREYHGEGIQHIALGDRGHLHDGRCAAPQGVQFQDTPDTYYEGVDARVPGHRENLGELQKRRILIDGIRQATACCCRSSRRTSSGRSSSRSSSARATKASAKAISGRCSSRSSSTRNAAA